MSTRTRSGTRHGKDGGGNNENENVSIHKKLDNITALLENVISRLEHVERGLIAVEKAQKDSNARMGEIETGMEEINLTVEELQKTSLHKKLCTSRQHQRP